MNLAFSYLGGYALGALLLLAVLWAPGRLLGHRFSHLLGELDTIGCLGLGMSFWSLAIFFLAAMQALQAVVVLALAAVVLSAALWLELSSRHARRAQRLPPARPSAPRLPALSTPAALILASLAAATTLWFFFAALPSIGWDDAVYHLRLPRLYLEHGGFRWVRFSFFSHWPQGMEMLYTLAMVLRDYVSAKLLHWSLAVLTCVLVFRIARRRCGTVASLAGAGLLAANPVFQFEARFAYVDAALAFFFLLAFRNALATPSSPNQEREGRPWLAGVFLGAMTAIKLFGWLAVASLGSVWAFSTWRARRNWLDVVKGALAIALPVAVQAVPWHVKAWLETGNPVYPFLFRTFGGKEWSLALANQMQGLQSQARGGLAETLLLPFQLAAGRVPGTDGSGGALHPLWLLGVPLAIYACRHESLARGALAVAGLYVFLWSLGPQQIRYLLPAIPLFAIAAAIGIETVLCRLERRRKLAEWLTAATCAGLLLWSLSKPAAAAPELLGHLAQHGQNLQQLMIPPAIRFLNERTPADATILFLNTNKAFFCQRQVLADSIFEASQVSEWLASAGDSSGLDRLLAESGVTHILWEHVDWGIVYPRTLLDLVADSRRAQPVFRSPEGRYSVLALRLDPAGKQTR